MDDSPPQGRSDDPRVLVSTILGQRETERHRLARLLHREISGALAAARMDLSRVASRTTDGDTQHLVQRVDQLLEQAIRDARAEMQRLHPALLDHFGLPAALRHLVEDTCRNRGIRYTLALDDSFESAPGALSIALYRLVEAVLGEPGLTQFDARLAAKRGGYELTLARRHAPGSAAAIRDPERAALRHWLRSLGARWADAAEAEAVTVTVRLPASMAAPKRETPAG
jgi:signal transduction histidine kinase